jgi:hypothetical protein
MACADTIEVRRGQSVSMVLPRRNGTARAATRAPIKDGGQADSESPTRGVDRPAAASSIPPASSTQNGGAARLLSKCRGNPFLILCDSLVTVSPKLYGAASAWRQARICPFGGNARPVSGIRGSDSGYR